MVGKTASAPLFRRTRPGPATMRRRIFGQKRANGRNLRRTNSQTESEISMSLRRRTFLSLTASAVAAGITSPKIFAQSAATPSKAMLRVSDETTATMPLDFSGLSFESPQLYNPSYFSKNISLVAAFKRLSPRGVLRFGGNLSDVARWKSDAGDFMTPKLAAAIEHGKTYREWKLTDPRVREDRGGAITPKAIRALRGFLDATGWKAIYGFNFGSGSPERARTKRCMWPRCWARS